MLLSTIIKSLLKYKCMKKVLFLFALTLFVLAGCSLAHAEDTLPPLPVPVIDDSPSPDADPSEVVTTYVAPSPTPTPARSVVVQNLSTTAETGSKLYILLAVSVLGGFGLFCIKKYLDSRHYSI